MSIDALIQGRLRGVVAVKTSTTGSVYAHFKISAHDKHGESLFVSCITFDAAAITAVERLTDGDSIAVSGEAAISTWRGNDGAERHGLDVTVHVVMSAYHAGRKRRDKPKPEASDGAGTDFDEAGDLG